MPDAAALPRVAVRFVAREPTGPVGRSQLKAEIREYGDVWVLPDHGDVDLEALDSELQRRRRRAAMRRRVQDVNGASGAGGAGANTGQGRGSPSCDAEGRSLAQAGLLTPDMLRRFLAKAVREYASVEYVVHMGECMDVRVKRAGVGYTVAGCKLDGTASYAVNW
jgi:hypothetical protein